jgi:glucosamine--fructose-6-phosphate aminotransferase (isomerizing)
VSLPDGAHARALEAGGDLFLGEIHEQPEALLRLLDQVAEFEAVARAVRRRRASFIRLVGHGSSDNAATYGVYAFGLLAGRSAVRDSISLTTYYGAELDFSGSVVVALSQSGQTPDVVDYVRCARARGALTIAITNDPGTALEDAADATLPLAAGPESAVAATKTYSNQLAALALLAAAIAGRTAESADALRRTAELLSKSLSPLEAQARPIAMSFAYVGRMYAIGRGLEFATAREVALKLTETCRIAAEPLTATDLAHGPIAAVDALFPVWTIATRDASLPAVVEAAERVKAAGATIVASGSAAADVEAPYRLTVPEAPSPVFAPLLSVVPGQIFAAALAHAKGLDADRPVGLSKVTIAR